MDTLTMARRKKEVTPNRQLAQAILDQYHPKSVEDMQEALKDIFGPMFEAMLQGEMNSHLGYPNNGRGEKETVTGKSKIGGLCSLGQLLQVCYAVEGEKRLIYAAFGMCKTLR